MKEGTCVVISRHSQVFNRVAATNEVDIQRSFEQCFKENRCNGWCGTCWGLVLFVFVLSQLELGVAVHRRDVVGDRMISVSSHANRRTAAQPRQQTTLVCVAQGIPPSPA